MDIGGWVRIALLLVAVLILGTALAVVADQVVPVVVGTGSDTSAAMQTDYEGTGSTPFPGAGSVWSLFITAVFGEDAGQLGDLIGGAVVAFLLLSIGLALFRWVTSA